MQWLNTINSTNFKTVVGGIMAIGTAIYFCTASFLARPVPEVAFGEWLTFVAAWAGISYLQFAKKRETFVPEAPDGQRETPVSDPPAISANPPATGSPVGGTSEPEVPDGVPVVQIPEERATDGGMAEADAWQKGLDLQSLPVMAIKPGEPVRPARLSEHFLLREFAVSAGHPELVEPVPDKYLPNVKRLVQTVLEPLRQKLALPMTVLSGYRSFTLNRAIGGSPTSQHMTAGAADWTVIDGPSMRDVMHDLMSGKYGDIPCGQCIFYPAQHFIHIALQTEQHPKPTFQIHWPAKGYRYRTLTSPEELLRLTRFS